MQPERTGMTERMRTVRQDLKYITADEKERVESKQKYAETVSDSVMDERFALRNVRGSLYGNNT